MAIIRWVLARFILLADSLYKPKGINRSQQEQTKADTQAAKLTLYQFKACPFCVKVRWGIKRLAVGINTKDTKRNPQYANELLTGGGSPKVPCLKIEDDSGDVTWMYDSSDILAFLDERFSVSPMQA